MKKNKLNLEKFVYKNEISENKIYEEIKNLYDSKKYKKSMELSLIAYRIYGNKKDSFGHPKFIKEAYRSSVEIPPNKYRLKIKKKLKQNLKKGDQCTKIFEERAKNKKLKIIMNKIS